MPDYKLNPAHIKIYKEHGELLDDVMLNLVGSQEAIASYLNDRGVPKKQVYSIGRYNYKGKIATLLVTPVGYLLRTEKYPAEEHNNYIIDHQEAIYREKPPYYAVESRHNGD